MTELNIYKLKNNNTSHKNALYCNTNSGFTLAESLITLGIIGVVAAMTIPNLLTNYKTQRLHSQFLKSYSTNPTSIKTNGSRRYFVGYFDI